MFVDRPSRRLRSGRPRQAGFTLTELLVTMGLIVVLLGLLVPALRGVFATGELTRSMKKMNQIGVWMQAYSSDNLDFIVPSQFDYRSDNVAFYSGKVRNPASGVPESGFGVVQTGSWADILWVEYANFGTEYVSEAPPSSIYSGSPGFKHPFRSVAANSRNTDSIDGIPTPYGGGANETGVQGYFSANNFFNMSAPSQPGHRDGLWTTALIRRPSAAMYLIDGIAGETIEPERLYFDPAADEFQVDFRYSGSCAVFALDGHVEVMLEYDELPVDAVHPNRIEIGETFRINELTLR